MGELKRDHDLDPRAGSESGFATTQFDALLGWAQKYSLFKYPFVTACCGMEFMAVASPRYDIARFGAEAPRFSPRQTDLLWVVGTISAAPGARAQAHLRADGRAQVGPRVRHLRVAAAASTTTTRRVAGHRQDHPVRRLRARAVRRAPRPCSTV